MRDVVIALAVPLTYMGFVGVGFVCGRWKPAVAVVVAVWAGATVVFARELGLWMAPILVLGTALSVVGAILGTRLRFAREAKRRTTMS